jgi:hypothetical protein
MSCRVKKRVLYVIKPHEKHRDQPPPARRLDQHQTNQVELAIVLGLIAPSRVQSSSSSLRSASSLRSPA